MCIKTWLTRLMSSPRNSQTSFSVIEVLKASIDGDGVTLETTNASLLFRPSKRPQFSPGRLLFTDDLHRSHAKQIQSLSAKELLTFESSELRELIVPVLVDWSSTKSKIDVLELGPAYTTVIAEELEKNLGSYCGVDFSPPYLQKQQERLQRHLSLRSRCRTIVSDTFSLSVPDESVDLVVTSCHPPLVSASVIDKQLVLTKIHQMLTRGGALAVFPWSFHEQPREVNEHLLQLFTVQRFAHLPGESHRALLILVKR